MLDFNGAWRLAAPAGDGPVPEGAIHDTILLISRVADQGDRQDILEHFKTHFARAAGIADSRSSDVGWAETDLRRLMDAASANQPLFIEAFYDACETLRERGLAVPDVAMLNQVLARHGIRYRVDPPRLALEGREHIEPIIAVAERPRSAHSIHRDQSVHAIVITGTTAS